MEEDREDKFGSVLALLQAQARGKASRITFKKMQDQKLALYCLQRTIRNFRIGKTWLWWQLWLAVKPNLKCTKFAQYKATSPSPDRSSTGIGKSRGVSQGLRAEGGLQVDIRLSSYLLVHVGHNLARGTHPM